jgi:hypothetical protein
MNARSLCVKLLSPFALVLVTAFAGTTIAATTTPYGAVENPSQTEGPVDCKKTPDHPRCTPK